MRRSMRELEEARAAQAERYITETFGPKPARVTGNVTRPQLLAFIAEHQRDFLYGRTEELAEIVAILETIIRRHHTPHLGRWKGDQ